MVALDLLLHCGHSSRSGARHRASGAMMVSRSTARKRISSALILLYLSSTVLCSRPDVTSTSIDPEPTLDVSVDGTCGNGLTCLGSHWGQCCSEHGYCGNSDAYCGRGCLPAFGECGVVGGAEQPTCSPTVTTTSTITRMSRETSTTTITRTSRDTLTIWKSPTAPVNNTRSSQNGSSQ